MTTPIEARKRLQAWRDGVGTQELGIGYCAGNDAFAADVIALLAAEQAEPVAFWRSIVDRAAIQSGMPQRTRLHLLRRFDALCAAPKATP